MDSEPFGQRAVRLGFATSEEIREALETQKMLAEKAGLLGEILVEMNLMDPMHYIEIVGELADYDGAAGRGKVQDRFVEIALERGYLSEAELEEARQVQVNRMNKNKLIGQIMVEMGILGSSERDRVLETYNANGKHI